MVHEYEPSVLPEDASQPGVLKKEEYARTTKPKLI